MWFYTLCYMTESIIVNNSFKNTNLIIIIIIHRVYIALYIKIDLKALNKLKHATLKILVKIQTIIAQQ